MRIIIALITLLLTTTIAANEDDLGKELLKAVKKGRVETIQSYLDKGADINAIYGKDMTLLVQSIRSNKIAVTRFLIENGADPDLAVNDKSPLMWTVQLGREDIARLLLENGANPNKCDADNNTPLIFTAIFCRPIIAEMLIEFGANIYQVNNKKDMAINCAMDNDYELLYKYLKAVQKRNEDARFHPDYFDGPHIEYIDKDRAEISYFRRDSLENKNVRITKTIDIDRSKGFSFDGMLGDTATYHIRPSTVHDVSQFSNVPKVLAVGDLHGKFEVIVNYLKSNKVIDEDLNWIWGRGHLVFLGDIFDRGEKVTEILWLLYKLEKQAEKDGGHVHLLLGNHEVMVMMNHLHYTHPKYMFFANYFFMEYHSLFSENTVLGEWLRSKNTIIKINDVLYTHGGISPKLRSKEVSIDAINKVIRSLLSRSCPEERTLLETFMISAKGPLWYRGYITPWEDYQRTSQEEINDILDYYRATHIVVGHTELKSIKSLYEGKVLTIDVPLGAPKFKDQALLVEDGKYFRLFKELQKEEVQK